MLRPLNLFHAIFKVNYQQVYLYVWEHFYTFWGISGILVGFWQKCSGDFIIKSGLL
jgi:hypothetical protein